jgi:hypothetical protein
MQESKLRDYLMGGLAPQERAEIEEHYFDDDALFASISALEEEIIRDYISASLSVTEAARFESQLVKCPDLRRKLEFSRGVASALSESPRRSNAFSPRASMMSWLVAAPPAWRYAAGIALLVVVGVGVTGVTNALRLNRRVMRLEAEAVQLREAANARPVFSFLLAPGITRGSTGRPDRLLIPVGATSVTLQLELGRGLAYGAWRVVLRAVGKDAQLWGGEARVVGHSVAVEVPAGAFGTDDYILELQGISASGAVENLESYSFGVRRD